MLTLHEIMKKKKYIYILYIVPAKLLSCALLGNTQSFFDYILTGIYTLNKITVSKKYVSP